MWRDKIILTLIVFLIAAVAVFGYIFFDYYTSIYKDLKIKNSNQNIAVGEIAGEANKPVPPGSMSLSGGSGASDGGGSLPVTTDPNGTQISMGSTGQALNGTNSGEANNNPNQKQGQENGLAIDLSDTSTWKTYTNKKYNYSFKYPKEFDYSQCDSANPCKYGQVYERDGGDTAWLNGSNNNQTWPFVMITHTDNESFTLPPKTKFFDWLKQKFGWSDTKDNSAPKDFNYAIIASKGDPKKAMRISIPQTPQAYARDEIYFEVNNKIFQIQLMDSNKEGAQQFYNVWLKTFVLN